jgi:hypothetical protein
MTRVDGPTTQRHSGQAETISADRGEARQFTTDH